MKLCTPSEPLRECFSGLSNYDSYDLITGPISSDAYLFSMGNASVNNTVIQRNKLDGTSIWLKALQESLNFNCATIDSKETNIYYSIYSTSYAQIVNLKTSDGTLVQTMKSISLSFPQYYLATRLSSDETYLYFQAQSTSDSVGQICKIKLSINTYFECAQLTGLTLPTTIELLQSSVYFTAFTSSSSTSATLALLDMTTGSYKWRSQILGTSSLSAAQSSALLNEDQAKIYTAIALGSSLVFLQLNSTNGAEINSKYLYSTSCSESNSLQKYKDRIYIVSFCNYEGYIVVMNALASTFSNYHISNRGYRIHSYRTDLSQDRMLICGHGTTTARSFSIITFEETLDIHRNITTSSNTFNLISSSQFPVSSSSISTLSISNYTITNSSLASYTTSEVLGTDQFESDVSYWLRDYYAYNLTHNTYLELDISLTCSSSGSVTVTHSMIANGANAIPSWVTIDGVNSKLKMTTPMLSVETNFTFGISSYVSVDSKSYLRYIYLQVIVSNTQTSSNTSTSNASTSNTSTSNSSTGNSNSSKENFSSSKGNTKSSAFWPTLIIIALAFIFESIVSLLNQSVSASFYLIIGQYQLLTILPCLCTFMPSDVIEFCAGLKVFVFSGNIKDPTSLPSINSVYSFMDKAQTDDYLQKIDLNSQSTFVNIFSTLCIILGTMILHILVGIVYYKFKPIAENEKRLGRKVIRIIYRFFTFDTYIRTFISIFLMVVLSAMLETYNSSTNAISIAFSGILQLLVMLFMIFCLAHWYSIRLSCNIRDNSRFRELYPELKDSTSAGLYTLFEQTRVVLLLICVSYGRSVSLLIRVIVYSICQTVFLLVMAWQRPFRRSNCNFLKVTNEVNYLVLCVALNFLKEESNWSYLADKAYLWLMVSISIQIVIICFIDFVVTAIKKCCKKSTQTNPKRKLQYIQNQFYANNKSKLPSSNAKSEMKSTFEIFHTTVIPEIFNFS